MVASAYHRSVGPRGAILTHRPPPRLRIVKALPFEVKAALGATHRGYLVEVELLGSAGDPILTFTEVGQSYARALWNMAHLLSEPAPDSAWGTVFCQMFHGLANSPN